MRVENWHSKLLAYIDQQERIPFAYGVNDCLLMTAGAVEVVTGVDHAASYRGRYSSLAQARKLIGQSPIKFVASLCEAWEHPSQAGDGDVAAMRKGREWTFGILIGPHFYVQTETGLGILPRAAAQKAFKVD
jgi:hypothetical protein